MGHLLAIAILETAASNAGCELPQPNKPADSHELAGFCFAVIARAVLVEAPWKLAVRNRNRSLYANK